MKNNFKIVLVAVCCFTFINAAEGYDQASKDFNQEQEVSSKKELAIDKEMREDRERQKKELEALSLQVGDENKQDYWIVRAQARNLFMAIEKNIIIGKVMKAEELIQELEDYVDMSGSDMAELALLNVSKFLYYIEIGEEVKAKISCKRAYRITHSKELIKSQKYNAKMTEFFCARYTSEIIGQKGSAVFVHDKNAYNYVMTFAKEERIKNHLKYINIINYLYIPHFFNTKSIVKEKIRGYGDELVRLYGINSMEKSRFLLESSEYIINRWQEREMTLYTLKEGYKMAARLLRERYEEPVEENLLIAKFLKSIGDNYYGTIAYKQSIPYYEKAIEIFRNNKFDVFLVESLRSLSYVYRLARNVDSALKTVEKTLKEAERVFGKDSVDYASILVIEADIYNIDKDYSNAIIDLEEARNIFVDKYGEYSNEVKLIDLNIKYIKLAEEASF